jgi:hypothetical protein
VDAERTGLVGGRQDDSAGASPCDDDGSADKLRMAKQFYRCVERVHVDMQDVAAGVIGHLAAGGDTGGLVTAVHATPELLPAHQGILSAT